MSAADTIAKEWLQFATQGCSSAAPQFFEFLAAWVAFNALYSSRSSAKGELTRIESFVRNPPIGAAHRALLGDPTYSEAVGVLAEHGVHNLQNDRLILIQDISDVIQVFRCVYQVRCNLFHGGKSPWDARDQQLVNAAATITKSMLSKTLT